MQRAVNSLYYDGSAMHFRGRLTARLEAGALPQNASFTNVADIVEFSR